jgi:hypothetical protein
MMFHKIEAVAFYAGLVYAMPMKVQRGQTLHRAGYLASSLSI